MMNYHVAENLLMDIDTSLDDIEFLMEFVNHRNLNDGLYKCVPNREFTAFKVINDIKF